jgi:hypothetical protein
VVHSRRRGLGARGEAQVVLNRMPWWVWRASSRETRTIGPLRVEVDMVHVRLAELPARCLWRWEKSSARLESLLEG